MKTHIFAPSLCCAAILAIASTVSLVASPIPLFDGKTLAGWEGDTQVWRIEEGALVAGRPDVRQPKNDFLCTTREFGDFELRLKYKRGPNNGGIQFRSQRVKHSPEVSGFQADFSPKIDGFLFDEARRRKFLAQPDPATIGKLNIQEWNQYRVRVEGSRIRLWVNDVLTVDYVEADPLIPRSGIIGLQLHANATEIRYKDIEIEELPPSQGQAPVPEFRPLFNGSDLNGWHYADEPDLGPALHATDGRYSASGGALVVNPEDPQNGPHLRQLWTTRNFPKDFVLKLEFRAEANADSGIFLRGKQLQCRDYWMAGPYYKLQDYKWQDWNVIEIRVRGTSAFCTCNGEVLSGNFQIPEDGPLGLEADRGRMEYRNIQIQEAP